jgi:hypothetical protein
MLTWPSLRDRADARSVDHAAASAARSRFGESIAYSALAFALLALLLTDIAQRAV